MPEGQPTIQRDLEKLEEKTSSNLMMFNRGKCNILNLRRNNPMRTNQLRIILSEKSLGILVNTRLNISQQFTLAGKKANSILR